MRKNPYIRLLLEIIYFGQDDIVTESPGINTEVEGSDDDIFNLNLGDFA